MPGTRSGEYAHLAASPGGSGPDMEREGGRVRVSRRARPGERSPAGSSPSLHHRSLFSPPPLWPLLSAPHPTPAFAQPSSAGSRGKLLIALRQPGTGNPEKGAPPARGL